MKKLCLIALAAASVLSTATIFAYDDGLSGYYSSQTPNGKLMASTNVTPQTEIRITNAKAEAIYVTIPNTNFKDKVDPGKDDFIKNDNVSGDTKLVLLDQSGNPFFEGYVCHYALVSTHGYKNSYGIQVSREKC